jgi:hypothetical protein
MRIATITVLSAALLAPLMVGCGDKEVSHSETQSTNPLTGNTTKTDQSTYQKDNGQTYTNKTQSTTPNQ